MAPPRAAFGSVKELLSFKSQDVDSAAAAAAKRGGQRDRLRLRIDGKWFDCTGWAKVGQCKLKPVLNALGFVSS